VAVEFALVFLLFFSLFYAIVAYGLVITLKQSLTLAAEEGARAAVQDAPDEATRLARAQTMANGVLSWLPGGGITVSATAANCAANPATRCVTVAVNYDYAGHPIVPALPLLGIAIPANLAASATVQY
jgi:Flp pilus assembly protein TadG